MQKKAKSLEELTLSQLQSEERKIVKAITALQHQRKAIVERKKQVIINNRITTFSALDKLWMKIRKNIELE